MNRRRFLASIPVGVLTAGCNEVPSSLGKTSTPTAVTQKQTEQFTATVVKVEPHNSSETPRPPVAGTFDCAAQTATIDGWVSTSSCRTVAIQALRYDESADRLTLVLFDKWDMPQDPEDIDCAGVTYNYTLRVKARETLSAELRVVHRSQGEEPAEQFTVKNEDC